MSYSDNCGSNPPPPIIKTLDKNFLRTSASLMEEIDADTNYSRD